MTSNVGADVISMDKGEPSEDTRKKVMSRFKQDEKFPVEFLNRIEEVSCLCDMSISTANVVLIDCYSAL